MIAALTGMGLSAAAGLNAYIPFIIVALLICESAARERALEVK